MKTRKFFWFRSLYARVTAWVFVFLAGFTIALAFLAFQVTRNWLENTAIANLEALASARQLAVEAYVNTQLDKLNAFEQPDLEIKIAALLEAQAVERQTLTESLIAEIQRKQLTDSSLVWVDIVDMEGDVILSTFPHRIGISFREAEFFTESIVTLLQKGC